MAGVLQSFRQSAPILLAGYRSPLPKALELGITTPWDSDTFLLKAGKAAAGEQNYSSLWPLLIGFRKHKPELKQE